jgi:4-hydroxy-tetrahydrodipicolinate synthase
MTVAAWPQGLVTALLTPLKDDEVDLVAFKTLIDYQIANGATGLVVSGGTGEYSALSFEERSLLFSSALEFAAGRVPVIAATGCLTTKEAIRLSQDAQGSGVAGLLLASPYAEGLNWEERFAFYTTLNANLSIPIMIYNTPSSGLLTFEQVRQLSTLSNVTAVKDSSGDPELMGDLLAWGKTIDFGVYVGKDSFLYEAISTGATGAVFGTANFVPAELSDFIAGLQANGPTPEAFGAWHKLRPLLRLMEHSANYVGLCKQGCLMRGIDVGDVRRPYMMPPKAEFAQLEKCLADLS